MTEVIKPYHVYPIAESSDVCDYCDEGAEFGPHFHEMYVTRDGAASRTADNLARVFCEDVAWLVDNYIVPTDLPDPEGWCDNPDDSEYLTEEAFGPAESFLSDAGYYSHWDDGYTIEKIVEVTSAT